MLLIALPSPVADALFIGYFLFLIYLATRIYKQIKNGRGREIMPLTGFGMLPVFLFALVLFFG